MYQSFFTYSSCPASLYSGPQPQRCQSLPSCGTTSACASLARRSMWRPCPALSALVTLRPLTGRSSTTWGWCTSRCSSLRRPSTFSLPPSTSAQIGGKPLCFSQVRTCHDQAELYILRKCPYSWDYMKHVLEKLQNIHGLLTVQEVECWWHCFQQHLRAINLST